MFYGNSFANSVVYPIAKIAIQCRCSGQCVKFEKKEIRTEILVDISVFGAVNYTLYENIPDQSA